MFEYKAYDVPDLGLELVSPFLSREERVSLIPGGKLEDWQPVLSALEPLEKPIHELVRGCDLVMPVLPLANHNVTSSNHGWVVNGKKAPGITAQIARRLRAKPKKYRKYTKPCVGVGISVDRELKLFAKGELPFRGLQNDSQAVVRHLFEKDISLVDGAVLVSNWNVEAHGCSATEIDLIGYHHVERTFVVVELKVTSTSYQEMTTKLKRARKDKSGFRKCLLGRYIAQVAVTTNMFENTYPLHAKGMLVIVEHRNSKVFSLDFDGEAFKETIFHPWIAGYGKKL